MLKWSVATSLKQPRGFLGLFGFYRRFIKNYDFITFALTQVLKDASIGMALLNTLWTPTRQ